MSSLVKEDDTSNQILSNQDASHLQLKPENNSGDEQDANQGLKKVATNTKIAEHQNDRYQTKLLGKGMFDESEENLNVSRKVKPNQYGLFLDVPMNNSALKNSQDQRNQNIENNVSGVRIGGQSRKLPSISNLQTINKIGLSSQQEFARISKKKQDIIPSPQLLRKKTNFKWSQISDFASFLKDAIPRSKKLCTKLKRNRQGLKRFFPLFEVFFDAEDKYLMSSKRMSCNSTSTFYITSRMQELFNQSNSFLGVVKSNFSGSIYNVFGTQQQQSKDRQILATIIYKNEITCSSTPRSIQVYILSPYYTYAQLSGTDGQKNLMELYDHQQNHLNRKIIKLVNKQPKYNQKKNLYMLDFHGKLKIDSVKNMILVEAQNEMRQVMLIAKTDENQFAMDVDNPLSPRVALAIANTSFDFKWVCQ